MMIRTSSEKNPSAPVKEPNQRPPDCLFRTNEWQQNHKLGSRDKNIVELVCASFCMKFQSVVSSQ